MTIRKGQKRKASATASVPDRPRLLVWLKDPGNAAAYIEVVLDEGNAAGLLQALRNVAEARGDRTTTHIHTSATIRIDSLC